MATNPSITTVSSGAIYSPTVLNTNFQTLATAIAATLGTDGTSGGNNDMTGDLNMNGNTIRNALFDTDIAGLEWQGNWAASTAYVANDVVRDTTDNIVYICITAHTSSGTEPIASNVDAAKWQLMVDASSLTGLANVVEDSTPQSGGNWDNNGFNQDFDDGTGIRDDSGNEHIRFQKTASAVNQLDITNAATGNGPTIAATGDDTNVDLNLAPQAAGTLNLKRASWYKGSDVASANSLTLGMDGNYFDVTGTTEIQGIATVGQGFVVKLHFDSTPQLTHNATSFVLPGGANITAAAGDEAEFIEYDTGNWRCTNYTKADGTATVVATASAITSGTEQATTSGTAINFTGLPSGIKRITVILNEVSLSGSDNILVQIGDSGGLETSGYLSSRSNLTQGSTVSVASLTSGFIGGGSGAGGDIFSGHMVLTHIGGNTWIESYAGKQTASTVNIGGGSKTLSAELDRLTLTRSGSNTFDAGSVNIFYET